MPVRSRCLNTLHYTLGTCAIVLLGSSPALAQGQWRILSTGPICISNLNKVTKVGAEAWLFSKSDGRVLSLWGDYRSAGQPSAGTLRPQADLSSTRSSFLSRSRR